MGKQIAFNQVFPQSGFPVVRTLFFITGSVPQNCSPTNQILNDRLSSKQVLGPLFKLFTKVRTVFNVND